MWDIQRKYSGTIDEEGQSWRVALQRTRISERTEDWTDWIANKNLAPSLELLLWWRSDIWCFHLLLKFFG